MNFSELGLHEDLQKAIDALGFVDCTPIQESSFYPIVEGKDLAGLAQTGTGKTGAFLIPLMERLARSQVDVETIETPTKNHSRSFSNLKSNEWILILVPTRELAEQVHQNILKFGESLGVGSVVIYGGTTYEKQKKALTHAPKFVVATPGRLIDLYKEHVIDLSKVRAIVFDEADRMFDMGFKDDMKYLLKRIPKDRQFLVYSATLNFDVLNVAYEFGANPIEVNIDKDEAKAENVKDELFHLSTDEKPGHLLSLLQHKQPEQAIVFSNFKRNVERIVQFLVSNGVPAEGISSLLSQQQRNRIMSKFKSGEIKVLVATDVAARGLDIKGVDLVINYELPDNAENYVHRIGRTGRAGREGLAFSMVSDMDVDALSRIEDYLGHKVAIGWMDDEHLIQDFKPFPKRSSSESFRESQNKRKSAKASSHQKRKPHRKEQKNRTDRPEGDKPKSDQLANDKRQGRRPRSEKPDGTKGNRQHRDRSSGRHGKKPLPQETKNTQATPVKRDSGNNKRHRSSQQRVRRSGDANVASTTKKTTSLGQKVGRLIKKIFS